MIPDISAWGPDMTKVLSQMSMPQIEDLLKRHREHCSYMVLNQKNPGKHTSLTIWNVKILHQLLCDSYASERICGLER